MRRIAVGLVTLLVLTSCTDDPTVSGPATQTPATQTPVPAPTLPAANDQAPAATPDPAEDVVDADNDGLFPTVVGATATTSDGTSWRVNVTLLSEYDSPARYADAWRVLDADDNELGIRVLTHDHAGEQPFTRSHTVDIPAGATTVFVEGRDQLNGWSGERFELTLDR